MNPHIVLNFNLSPSAASHGIAADAALASEGGLPTPFAGGAAEMAAAELDASSTLPSPLDNLEAGGGGAGTAARSSATHESLPTPFDLDGVDSAARADVSGLPTPLDAQHDGSSAQAACSACDQDGGASGRTTSTRLPVPQEREAARASEGAVSLPRPDGTG